MESNKKYAVCTRCVMDTSDPNISFDEFGRCNHCSSAIANMKRLWPGAEIGADGLNEVFQRIRVRTSKQAYTGILGISGGVDSSYAALLSKKYGLNPLLVHVDAGWNSDEAVSNIHALVSKLDLDLVTVVIDWQEMRDLQIAYLRSGVANQDVPQDHAFFAATYRLAKEMGINQIISGGNFSSESILPKSWGYDALDGKNLKSIHKVHGDINLVNFPTINLPTFWVRRFIFKDFFIENPLNFYAYNKELAKETLKNEVGWTDYGGKHRESRFTEFFQHIYLPTRYGYDKRKAHLSSLIVSGQVTREQALNELAINPMSETEIRQSVSYVERKLELENGEIDRFLKEPLNSYKNYANDDWIHKISNNKWASKLVRKVIRLT